MRLSQFAQWLRNRTRGEIECPSNRKLGQDEEQEQFSLAANSYHLAIYRRFGEIAGN